MSNDDSTPQHIPRDDSETGLGRLGQDAPDDGVDTGADDETSVFAPPTAEESTPPGGGVPVDATQVMPVTPTPPPSLPSQNPTILGGAVPPMMPAESDTTTVSLDDPPVAWYQQPGLVAGVLLGLLAIGALVVFLFLLNDDDADLVDDTGTEPVTMSITRVDANGNPLGTTLAAEVTAADAAPFTWLSPPDVPEGEPGRLLTDATGRAEFRWMPAVDDLDGFATTVVVREFVAGTPDTGDFVASIDGACTIDTDGEPSALDVDISLVADTANDSTTQAGEYTFPNATFGPGDRIECTLSDIGPGTPPPTTVPPESSTVPDTAVVTEPTEVPETTVPPTTVPETTTSTTTTSTTTTTTTTTTTLPPEPVAPVLGDVLRADPDLSQALGLLTRVGLLDDLENATQPFTLFVPDNASIDALRDSPDAPDLDDDDVVRSILQAHLSRGQAFTSDQIASTSQIPVESGRPQPVDGAANPPTIGGVPIIVLDREADGGIVHVLGGVIERL